jgi:hypothetical protein
LGFPFDHACTGGVRSRRGAETGDVTDGERGPCRMG